MWINFKSDCRFAIKIFVGGVNAISGEPVTENAATKLRRLNLVAYDKSIQDYVVTPDQLWLDGIASENGHVRQFIAMPLGSGYSVEAQVTGEDVAAGLQFEITPSVQPMTVKDLGYRGTGYPIECLYVARGDGDLIELQRLTGDMLMSHIAAVIEEMTGKRLWKYRLLYDGGRIEDGIQDCPTPMNVIY